MKIPIAVRIFLRGKLHFQERLEVSASEIQAVAMRHVKMIVTPEGVPPHMIEIEFLDDPMNPNRFVRMGTDPTMMTIPLGIKDDRLN